MIIFTKAHPVTQAMSAARAPVDLNEPGLRRNPGEPSAEQSEASTYNKPRIKWHGLTIAVENPAGSVRRGRNRHGVTWEVRMRFDYGEVVGSMGVDGDPVDIYMGPNPDAPMVYVVHQRRVNDWTEYDEDKVMAGFDCQADAEAAFLSNYNDPRFLGPVTAMPVAEFVAKVRATKGQPAMIKAAAPVVLFFKAHVGAYLRGGKMVNLSGYQGRAARAVATPGQLSLFGSNEHVSPGPAESAPDLIEDDLPAVRQYSRMTPAERAAFDGRNGITQSRRELVAEHERLVDVLNSPSREDDKVEAKRQEKELTEMKDEAKPEDAAPKKHKEDPRIKEVGQRVILSRVKQAKYIGMSGHVAGYVKSRGVVKVALDSGGYYDASPENVDVQDDGVVGAGFKEVTDAKAKRESSAARRAEKQERERVEREKTAKAAEKKAEKVSSVMPDLPESEHDKVLRAVQRARRGNAGSHVVVSHYGAPFNYIKELPFKTLDAAQRYADQQKEGDGRIKGTHGVFSPKGGAASMTKSIVFLRPPAS